MKITDIKKRIRNCKKPKLSLKDIENLKIVPRREQLKYLFYKKDTFLKDLHPATWDKKNKKYIHFITKKSLLSFIDRNQKYIEKCWNVKNSNFSIDKNDSQKTSSKKFNKKSNASFQKNNLKNKNITDLTKSINQVALDTIPRIVPMQIPSLCLGAYITHMNGLTDITQIKELTEDLQEILTGLLNGDYDVSITYG